MKKVLSFLSFAMFFAIFVPSVLALNELNMAAPYHLNEIKVKIHQMDKEITGVGLEAGSSIRYYLPGDDISWSVSLEELSGDSLAENRIWPSSEIVQLKTNGLGYNVLSKLNYLDNFVYTYKFPLEYVCISPLYLHISDSYGADVYLQLGTDHICNNVDSNGVILDKVKVNNLAPVSNTAYPLQVNSSAELARIKEYFSLVKTANDPKVYLVSKSFGIKYHVIHMAALRTWWDAFDKKIDIVSDNELNKLEDGLTNDDHIGFRPGTLIKSSNDPKVYLVVVNGSLWHIDSERSAREFAGPNWNKEIYTVSQEIIDNSNITKYNMVVPDAVYLYGTFPRNFYNKSVNMQVERTNVQ